MQDPTWRDVLDYIVAGLLRGDWPVAACAATTLAIGTLRLTVGWAWARHRRHQQLATFERIITRWMAGWSKPFAALSTVEQLATIEQLRATIVGSPTLVLQLLAAIRVMVETVEPDSHVLEALDRLAGEWQEKLPSARRRRYRRDREHRGQMIGSRGDRSGSAEQ